MTILDWTGKTVYSQANGKRVVCEVGEFIQKGGEGSVYRDLKRRNLALKIMHEPSDRTSRKLHLMLSAAPELQTQLEPDGTDTVQIAWPQEILFDAQNRFCGFSMRYLDFANTVSLNAWFDRRSRARNVLSQDDRVRIYLAANLASVTEYIHKAGHAVIDFKPQNVRAYREHGYVCLVDCDGFLIRSGAAVYPAAVATPAFLAPEHQKNFDPGSLDETHDRFALAVMLYMLLDNGFSPASGSSDRLPHDVNGRLAAGAVFLDSKSGLTPPAGSHYRFFPDATLAMFRRAFTTVNRPTSGEWKAHLRDLTTAMVQCKARAEHWHYGKGCPWCAIASSPSQRVQVRAPSSATVQPSPAANPRLPQYNARNAAVPPSPGTLGSSPPPKASAWPWIAISALSLLAIVMWIRWAGTGSATAPPNRAPEHIVDPERCLTQRCLDGERWLARRDAELFANPPQVLGTPRSSLSRVTVVPAGGAVQGRSLVTLEKWRDGIVIGDLVYGVGVSGGPQLTVGTRIALYADVEDGCFNSWINGRVLVICGGVQPQGEQAWETWIQVETNNGIHGWFRHSTQQESDKALVSQTQLNDELATAIQSKLSSAAKLAKIDALLREGAQLNGRGNKHGTDPVDAVTMTKDVELLDALMSRGLEVHNGRNGMCTAHWLRQGVALEPGGDLMLDALLAKGMRFDCTSAGRGTAAVPDILKWGIDSSNYSIDRAIRAAEVLVKHGADVNQRDAEGKTIFDSIDARISSNPALGALRTALLDLGRNQPRTTTLTEIQQSRDAEAQVFRIGDGVTAPAVIEKIEPGYSEAARQESISGVVRLNVEVDTNGRVRNARIVRGLGYGLDEKAIEAVNRWRFRPGQKDGRPVIVAGSVEVTFRLATPPPDPIARLLAEAEQKIARRDYNGALADAESAVRAAPNDKRAAALLERVRRIRAILN